MTRDDYRQSHQGCEIAAGYERDFASRYPAVYWQLVEKNLLDEVLTEALTAPLDQVRHLDIACGTGRVLEHLSKGTRSSAGVDISPAMLAHVRHRAPSAGVVVADVTQLPFTAKFDLITGFRFFLNADTELRREALRAAHDALRPNGLLVVNTHCQPWSALGMWRRTKRRLDRPADQVQSVSAFRSLLLAAGFEPVADRTYGYVPLTSRLPAGLLAESLCRADRALIRSLPPRSSFASSWLVAARRG